MIIYLAAILNARINLYIQYFITVYVNKYRSVMINVYTIIAMQQIKINIRYN